MILHEMLERYLGAHNEHVQSAVQLLDELKWLVSMFGSLIKRLMYV